MLGLLACTFAAAGAAELIGGPVAPATEAYKYRLPDGSVLYTDQRQPDGRLQEVLPLDNREPPAAARATPATPSALERAADQRTAQLEAAAQEVQDAQRDLAAAEEAAREGREPEDGERLGTANGRSRLAPAYFQRRGELRAEVERARARLDAANAALAALR